MHVNCVANRARLPEAAKATVLAVAARTTAFALTHADAMWPQRCTPLGVEQLCRACSLQEQSRTPWRTRNIKLSAHDTQALFKIIVEAWSGSCGGCVRVQDCKSLGVGGDCLGTCNAITVAQCSAMACCLYTALGSPVQAELSRAGRCKTCAFDLTQRQHRVCCQHSAVRQCHLIDPACSTSIMLNTAGSTPDICFSCRNSAASTVPSA